MPIIGIGGVSNWKDAIAMIMAGATCVGICTASILKGPKIFESIVTGIEKFLLENNYKSLADIRGLGLKSVEEEWSKEFATPLYAKVNANNCTGCELCADLCLYDAIKMIDQKAHINQNNCSGCGLCESICPVNAIELVLYKK